MTNKVIIVGAGVFGITTALALWERNYDVTILDPGPIPHPLASSTDIAKVVRMEYGADEQYMAMVEAALEGWDRWNTEFSQPVYHQTGVLMVRRTPMNSGDYEYESYQTLLKRGHTPQRLSADEIAIRFPAWKPETYVDGFFHQRGGYAESSKVIVELLKAGEERGIHYQTGHVVDRFIERDGHVTGVRTRKGDKFEADIVVICAGAWTRVLIPELNNVMKSTGHSVFHLTVPKPDPFTPPHFSVFTADITSTGWYGFPAINGEIKLGHHGPGQPLHPINDKRVVPDSDREDLRNLLRDTFPALENAEIVYSRVCLYCDTLDEHFWIDYHPEKQGLFVAAGGSGHGFKFAPILGNLVADAIERKANNWLPRFRWRELDLTKTGEEAARYRGEHVDNASGA
ncbi:MAG: FAD-dependent oxidoreductase [Chloroflexi bacterium]|nr:FAD-dependent oxidoreductase [Chloroflexota bacterium]